MHIERINENQIRCIITREDLDARQIKVSELAYGTEKAKTLFREMMSLAYENYGFEIENAPLMIEAVPLSSDAMLLIVTRVTYPDEVDPRFAHFSDTGEEESMFHDGPFASPMSFEGIYPTASTSAKEIIEECQETKKTSITKQFVFTSLDVLIKLANKIAPIFKDSSRLYKANHAYYLLVDMKTHSADEFNKVCNIISEYAQPVGFQDQSLTYLYEHGQTIIKENAIETLAKI